MKAKRGSRTATTDDEAPAKRRRSNEDQYNKDEVGSRTRSKANASDSNNNRQEGEAMVAASAVARRDESITANNSPPAPVEPKPAENNDKKETFEEGGGGKRRWRAHQMAEDYVELAGHLMFHTTTHLGTYGYDPQRLQYPLEFISALGYLTSPARRPTIIERWSPYEITLFEAGLGHFGKNFHQVQRVVKTKSTKEIIDFYYIWKKTSHYKNWKRQYVPPEEHSNGKKGPTKAK